MDKVTELKVNIFKNVSFETKAHTSALPELYISNCFLQLSQRDNDRSTCISINGHHFHDICCSGCWHCPLIYSGSDSDLVAIKVVKF